MIDVGRVYVLPVNIGIGVEMGGCLSSAHMVPSLSSSEARAENWRI